MTDFLTSEKLDSFGIKLDVLALLIERKTPEFYTVLEASGLLRCSTSLIRDKMRHGELPFQRLGNSETSPILIRRNDILGMLK